MSANFQTESLDNDGWHDWVRPDRHMLRVVLSVAPSTICTIGSDHTAVMLSLSLYSVSCLSHRRQFARLGWTLHCTALHCIALHCTALQGERRATRRHACREATHALGCLSALTHFRFCMWAPPYASLLPTAAFPVTVMWMLATVVYHSTAARTSISSLSRSASKTITPPPSDALASQSSLITGNVLSDLYRPLNRLSHANRTANRDATESFVHAVNT